MINSIIEQYKINSINENHSIVSRGEIVNLTITGGDMNKSIYDTDNNNIVDVASNSLKLGSIDATSYLKDYDIIDCGTF